MTEENRFPVERMPYLVERMRGFGTTIFAEMSALAVATGSINLGQGFPDTDGPPEVVEAAIAAIRAGDNLGLFYASANRDEEIFEEPTKFKVDRQPNRHLAFGMGPHMCLGNILARMEMRIFYAQFLPRIESIELAGEPDFLRASFVHGAKHLPIRFKLRPAA
jgi:hypothetical protein